MIRIGMLSYWHLHAADYTRAAIEHPGTEIVAVWDEDPVRGATEARALDADFHADLAELLARDDIDAVVVGTPTNRHHEVIIAAARAGKHIFSEKVVAATVAEADEIIAEVTAADVVFAVSMWRSDEPVTAVIDRILHGGALGRVTELRIRDGHPLALPTAAAPDGRLPAQFWDPVAAQGGILIDLCHPVYLAAHFLGLPVEVSATFGRVTGHQLEDNVAVTMRYADGALAVLETSSSTAFSPFSIEAHGTEGSLVYSVDGIGELVARRTDDRVAAATPSPYGPDGAVHVRSVTGPPVWERVDVPAEPRRSAFEKWVQHIQDDTRASDNVELARRLSLLVEAAYRSDAERRRVTIAEIVDAD
jgi:1,5-anhydro-D-fructose reductase (1,5-anhydro-D-mannitol-forming)